MNSVEQRLAELEQLVMLSGREIADTRLDDNQKRFMKHFMDSLGLSEQEAKVRVLCMGTPPDHMKRIDQSGGSYPRILYHANGKFAKVADEEQHKTMKKEGWGDKPLPVHLKKLQVPQTARDERVKQLQKELEAEIKSKAEETVAA
jgi:hypothetical protein